tara:strand:+ start:277 stop:1413 length:1137 start_codon:yes stop_codon:yes gene_type:complete
MNLKWTSLLVLAIQNALTPLIFRYVMTSAKASERFVTVEAIFMQEALKLFLSFLLLFWEESQSMQSTVATLKREILDNGKDTLKLGIPAVLYFIQNICLQLASANLPAAVFQVTYQGKSLVVALCSVTLLSKMLTRIQWLSIGLMGSGLAVVQLARSTESKQTANQGEQSISLGLTYTVIGAFCSGFAGVYFEKMMKSAPTAGKSTNKKPSMWVRNIQLASFSMIIGLLNMIAKSISTSTSQSSGNIGNSIGTDSTTAHYFLKGFTWAVWGMVINNAVGGLCVAMVIKYADNILKGFACAVATIFAAIACVPLFGFTLKPVFIIGMVIVLISVLLYGGNIQIQNSYWNQEPPVCRKFREGSGSGGGKKMESKNNVLPR